MLLMTMIRTRGGRNSTAIEGTEQVLLGQAEFRRILAQERERSDRNSHGFSLVLFRVASLDESAFERFLRLLARRCRRLDVLGWFDSVQVGVLLTDAPAGGARRFCNDLMKGLADAKIGNVRLRLFTYGFDPAEPRTEPSIASDQRPVERRSNANARPSAG